MAKKDKHNLVDKIRATLKRAKQSKEKYKRISFVADLREDTPDHILEMIEEYEKVKEDPHQPITGWDFDRAFEFIEKYPESIQTANLLEEMFDTTRQTLKGLSYNSALKVLQMMPSHPGAQSIIKGMYQIKQEQIVDLKSDVIMFIMEIAPDHPEIDALGEALVYKNFTNAYHFIESNPNHPESKKIIEKMFEKDPNIATLLLKENMDHVQVDSIFEGIYNINAKNIKRMMPDALIFILEVAPDHKYERLMIATLIQKNYIKAFEFVKENPEYAHAEYMKKIIRRKKPELAKLFEDNGD